MAQDREPVVLASGLAFPEGPAFDDGGRLWAVEVHGGALLRLGASGPERLHVGGAPNGIAFNDGRLWFCDAGERSVRRLEADGHCTTVVAEVAGVTPDKPNDLAFDATGNLVFTCPGESRREPTGSIWCRRVDGTVVKVADGLYFPNGLAFDPSGTSLIVAETYRHRLWKGAWDSAGARWIDAAPWAHVGGPIGPDGMAFDSAQRLYVAVFDQSEIAVVDRAGQKIDRIPTPGTRPTNVAFDPSGRLGLVVTEAEHGELLSYSHMAPGCPLFTRSSHGVGPRPAV